jgi:hypothetical protein
VLGRCCVAVAADDDEVALDAFLSNESSRPVSESTFRVVASYVLLLVLMKLVRMLFLD